MDSTDLLDSVVNVDVVRTDLLYEEHSKELSKHVKFCGSCNKLDRNKNLWCSCGNRALYTPEEIKERIQEYLAMCGNIQQIDYTKQGDEIMKWKFVPATESGLCVALGISERRYKEYLKKPQYSEVLEPFQQVCAHHLELGGLDGRLNSTMSIFALKNKFNWVEKQEVHNIFSVDEQIKKLEESKVVVNWLDNTDEKKDVLSTNALGTTEALGAIEGVYADDLLGATVAKEVEAEWEEQVKLDEVGQLLAQEITLQDPTNVMKYNELDSVLNHIK